MLIWLDESGVLSTMEITGMYKYAVKPVLPRFGPVSRLVEEVAKVDFEGEFEATIDLRGELGSNRYLFRDAGGAHLDHGVTLRVVLLALQRQVQHWWE